MSTQISPNSTPATARSRSASSSTKSARDDLSVIETLAVPTPSGVTVPLSSVAEIRFGQGPSSIQRFNRERRVVIGADMVGGMELGEGLGKVRALPEVQDMSDGVRIQETGDAEIMGEVFSGFASAMGTGLMMVLGVLILLFGSVFQPVTILCRCRLRSAAWWRGCC